MAQLTLRDVAKSYNGVDVIKNIDLDIGDGEFVVFVGPSGCGKSTLLRMIAGLEEISGGIISIGSGVPYSIIEGEPVLSAIPALAQAARTVGSPQIRAAGSLGGNLGTCSPAGDTLPVMFALDAMIHLSTVDSSRVVSIHDFMTGVKRSVRQHDEIITTIDFPIINGWQGYSKVGVRNAMVISVASACLVADHENADVRIALGSVGPTIIRCRAAEGWLKSTLDLSTREAISLDVANEFGRRAAEESSPIDDHRSTAQYRRHAISVLASRLLRKAYQ